MTTCPVIPRYYWESKVKEDPHLREDDYITVIPRHYWESKAKQIPTFVRMTGGVNDDRRSQDDGRDGDDESSETNDVLPE
ncbi:hypothetical protein [Thalassotalea litorea]|uniref:hypothetical protein n=1 Tax=Thalassotalea litorea TaxID=2020715 RepID=UPI003736A46C